MTGQSDLEQRLHSGLRRWAESGQPTIDLEESVRQRARELSANRQTRPRRQLPRWAAGLAAAAAMALALMASLPAWAGAASEWPLVGPALTEIVLKDAGLTWAYENGLIRGTVAETRIGEVRLRVLGILADSRRTTVIYQISGWNPPGSASRERPTAADAAEPSRPFYWLSGPPPAQYPHVAISQIDGDGVGSGMPAPVQTPLGLVGTVSTGPLPGATATIELTMMVENERVTLPIKASRAEADRLSQEVQINQSQRYGDITVTVKSVIYTPAETVVRYQTDRLPFYGFVEGQDSHYLEKDGKRYPGGGASGRTNGDLYESFAPVRGPFTLVIPSEVQGVAVELTWPLEQGALQQVGGATIELRDWQQLSQQIGVFWVASAARGQEGIAQFSVLDASGREAPPPPSGQAQGYSRSEDGTLELRFETELPVDFVPAAVRASQAGQRISGPWRFDIP